MATETGKTHASLQACSTESLLSSLGLGIFCLVADRILQFSIIQQSDWIRALSDNAVHCVIGMWSWAIVIGIKKKTDVGEIVLAGFLASVIDVDHFLLARSLSLKFLEMYSEVAQKTVCPEVLIDSGECNTEALRMKLCFTSKEMTLTSPLRLL